jgi:hypothetical protein
VSGGAIHLATGAVFDAEGRPRRVPKLPVPSPFPYHDPDPVTAIVVARSLYLAGEDRYLNAAPLPRTNGRARLPRPKRKPPKLELLPV